MFSVDDIDRSSRFDHDAWRACFCALMKIRPKALTGWVGSGRASGPGVSSSATNGASGVTAGTAGGDQVDGYVHPQGKFVVSFDFE